MPQSRILFTGHSPTVTRAVKRALASAGHEVVGCPFERSALARLVAEPFDLFVADADIDDLDSLFWALDLFKNEHPAGLILLLSSELGNEEIIDQLVSARIHNLIGKHVGLAASRDCIDEAELIATVDKLLRSDIFGIDRYLPPRVCVHSHRLERSTQRQEMLEELGAFLSKIDCYRSIEPMILTVADELLMNAVFSAPRDARGNPKYELVERNRDFVLQDNEHVDFRYACDGRSVFVSVADQFGSLEWESLVGYLGSGFLKEKATLREGGGGAGIGLYMIAHSITQLVFNIHKNVRTEVIASFYVRSGLRAFRESGQSLNLFVLS